MGFFKNKITRLQMVTERGNGFYVWNGNIYQSDIVLSCLHPYVKAVGKLVGKHIRKTLIQDGSIKIDTNPDAYIRFLLEEPNPYMTGQKFQEKLATQLRLNGNAFAVIIRDPAGLPKEIYPIPATGAEAKYNDNGELFLKFYFLNGKSFLFAYSDIIHLRQDFSDNDIFGNSIAPALTPLMDIVTTTDQGIVKAVKNSGVVRWLLKYNKSMRPEDMEDGSEKFAKSFLGINSVGGVAATDAKADAQQIEPKDYVPNASQMEKTTQRIYCLFNTNIKIIQSIWTEDEWNSYYEAEIEPIAIELAGEYTRKIFSRRERGFGNAIIFDALNLTCASMSTKLSMRDMVDRGALTPNEWREVMNLAPIAGGDKPVRRLDTAVVGEKKGGDE